MCDRPAALSRVLEELGTLGVEQVIIVSSAAESPGPHALVRRPLDGRGRLGEYLQSADVASVRDASLSAAGIGHKAYYRTPVHRQPPMLTWGAGAELPATEYLAATHVAIPMSPVLTRGQVDEVLAAARAVG